MPLRADEAGQLDVDSLATLSQAEVRDWFVTTLTGMEVKVAGPNDGLALPHYVFLQVFFRPEVGADFRERLRLAMLDGLYDLASDDEESIWRGTAGDRLLQLVEPLMRDREYGSRAKLALVHIVSLPEPYGKLEPNLHLRALQALVRMEYIAEPEFWTTKFCEGMDERYGPIVLAGLTLRGADDALQWLSFAPVSQRLDQAAPAILADLLARYSRDHICAAIRRALSTPVIGPRRAALQSLAQSLAAAPKMGPEAVSQRAQEFLVRTGQEPQPDLLRQRKAGP